MQTTFQDFSAPQTVRTAAILTGSYVSGTVLETGLRNQLILFITFTKGSLTSAEIKLEFSNDDSTYYQETARLVSGGTSTDSLLAHTYTADGSYILDIPIMYRYVKVSAKGTGTTTGSSMGITAVIGTV